MYRYASGLPILKVRGLCTDLLSCHAYYVIMYYSWSDDDFFFFLGTLDQQMLLYKPHKSRKIVY